MSYMFQYFTLLSVIPVHYIKCQYIFYKNLHYDTISSKIHKIANKICNGLVNTNVAPNVKLIDSFIHQDFPLIFPSF